MIGPETDETSVQLMEKTKATIPNLNDVDGAAIAAYRLGYELTAFFQQAYAGFGLDLPKSSPGTGWMLPVPATYVIGQEQRVTARYVNADYTARMEPAAVLGAAQAAAAK